MNKSQGEAAKQRKNRMSREQKEALVAFMADHPELVSGKFTGKFTFKSGQLLWEEFATMTNKLGPEKNKDGWKKSWQDLRLKAKTAKAENVLKLTKTGGGEADVDGVELTPTKEKILAISGGRLVVGGDRNIPVLGLGTKFDEFSDVVVIGPDDVGEDPLVLDGSRDSITTQRLSSNIPPFKILGGPRREINFTAPFSRKSASSTVTTTAAQSGKAEPASFVPVNCDPLQETPFKETRVAASRRIAHEQMQQQEDATRALTAAVRENTAGLRRLNEMVEKLNDTMVHFGDNFHR